MIRFITMVALVLIATQLYAITPEELVRLSEKGAADKRRVDQQLKLDDLHYKLRMDALTQTAKKTVSAKDRPGHTNNPSTMTAVQKPSVKDNTDVDAKKAVREKHQSTKYSSQQPRENHSQQNHPQRNHPQNQRNAQRQVMGYADQAPQQNTASSTTAKGSNKTVTTSDAVEPDTKKYFGIRRGTWIKAELRRDINNAEPGDVELYLSQEIYGTKHTLALDTQLFANKGLNTATQRLDMLTTYAITPAGREFVLKARIYDTFKVSGLVGIIDVDDSKMFERGTSTTLASLGTGVLKEVGGSSVVGNALSKGGQSIISDQNNASRRETEQQITIFVAPQPVLLRVEETF